MSTFLVRCQDAADSHELRKSLYDAHKAYLAADVTVHAVMSGPLLDAPDGAPIGSFFIVRASDVAAVAAFNANDPFATGGVWGRVEIDPVDVRVDDRRVA